MTTYYITRFVALLLLDSGAADGMDLRCKDFPGNAFEPSEDRLYDEDMTLEEWEQYESECWTGLQTGDEEAIRESIEDGDLQYYTEFAIWL